MAATYPDLRGRRAVVTGGAGGIGSAIGRALVEQGVAVLLCDRSGPALDEAARAIGGDPALCRVRECDVTDEASVRALVDAAVADGSGLDLVVNCAAVRGAIRRADELTFDEWSAVLAVGLTGVWLVSKHAAPHLAAGRPGAIVNIGSTAGRLPRLGQLPYCVAKAGVEQLTRVMALELADRSVRVNAVCPGATATPLLEFAAAAEGRTGDALAAGIVHGDPVTFRAGIPLQRIAAPADHASAVLFLASDAARHVTGQALYVDGGETML